MSIEGVDCSDTIVSPAALKAAGKHFACRYLSTTGNPKNLHAAEATGLHSAGLEVVSVFETTANRALGDSTQSPHDAGIEDARSAAAQPHALGAPADVPIYFAVDFDMQALQFNAVRSYFEGAVSVLGHDRVGGYGGLALMELLSQHSTCKYLWQTLAWSQGQWHKAAQLQQYENGQTVAGLSVDLDRAMAADYGQWHRPAPKRVWPKPDHWNLAYTDIAGKRQSVHTKHPVLWQTRHRHAKDRGEVVQIPVFHPIKK
jgi:hypothetical protein